MTLCFGTEPIISKSSPSLIIRIMPAIYLKHKLVLTSSNKPHFSTEKREVYLSNISDLDSVLNLLSTLIKISEQKFLFCLHWNNVFYYFNFDGSYYRSTVGPSSSLSY
jgi:hypothetical protein